MVDKWRVRLGKVCIMNTKVFGYMGRLDPGSYNFPGHSFRSKGESQSFKAALFDNSSWLDYQEVNDSVLC